MLMSDPTPPELSTAPANVEQALYEKRQKVYPREVHGTFAALRVTT